MGKQTQVWFNNDAANTNDFLGVYEILKQVESEEKNIRTPSPDSFVWFRTWTVKKFKEIREVQC